MIKSTIKIMNPKRTLTSKPVNDYEIGAQPLNGFNIGRIVKWMILGL